MLYEHPFKSDAPNLTHAWKNDPKNASCVFPKVAIPAKTRAYLDYFANKGDVPLYDVMAV